MKISSHEAVIFDAPVPADLPSSVLSRRVEALQVVESDRISPKAATEIGGVALLEPLESDPYAAAGISQLEMHANDPLASAEDFFMKTGTDKNGKTTRSTYAVMPDGSQKRTSANEMLMQRGYDPGAYKDHKTEVKAAEATSEVSAPAAIVGTTKTERPISARRFEVEKAAPIDAEGMGPVVTSRLGKMVEKISSKVTSVAERVEGASDIRRDTKRMIEQQREVLSEIVDKAKIERVSARKSRTSALIHNNVIARRIGPANRKELHKITGERLSAKYKAIGQARKLKNEKRNRTPGTESRTDKLRKFGAVITSGFEARAMIRSAAKAELARTKTERAETRAVHERQKDRRASLRRGVFHSGRTLSGAVDSLIGSFSRAGEFARTSEEDRIAAGKERVTKEFEARSAAARERAKARTAGASAKLRATRKPIVDKFKLER